MDTIVVAHHLGAWNMFDLNMFEGLGLSSMSLHDGEMLSERR